MSSSDPHLLALSGSSQSELECDPPVGKIVDLNAVRRHRSSLVDAYTNTVRDGSNAFEAAVSRTVSAILECALAGDLDEAVLDMLTDRLKSMSKIHNEICRLTADLPPGRGG